MKKLVVLGLVACSSVFANTVYIGAGANIDSITRNYVRTYDDALVSSVDGDGKGIYFKIGVETKSKDRLEFVYGKDTLTNSNNSSDSNDVTSFEFNGIISIIKLSNHLFLPYFKGGFGIYQNKEWDKTGFGAMIGLGTYINITQNIEADLSYKFKFTRTDINDDYYMMDYYNGLSLGVNYKF